MPNMTPLARYQHDLTHGAIQPDARQKAAMGQLQRIYDAFVESASKRRWPRLRKKEPVTGLYFWGGVGRGKTYLMDLFFKALPFKKKMRMHYHEFMAKVHHDLKQLKGQKDPLKMVAKQLASQANILCLDEFVVIDIADAMVLGVLLESLFAQGVTLVTTSNVPPDGLYKDGLQRDRFLPAIALLKKYTQVLNVDSGVDYRLRDLHLEHRYFTPLAGEAVFMAEAFQVLTQSKQEPASGVIQINGRQMPILGQRGKVVWVNFKTLCEAPRAQQDYLALAEQFEAVLLSQVPQLSNDQNDAARRFINLIDILYDQHILLVLSATVPIDQLYTGQTLAFEFERTRSRLYEMQSKEYLEDV